MVTQIPFVSLNAIQTLLIPEFLLSVIKSMYLFFNYIVNTDYEELVFHLEIKLFYLLPFIIHRQFFVVRMLLPPILKEQKRWVFF